MIFKKGPLVNHIFNESHFQSMLVNHIFNESHFQSMLDYNFMANLKTFTFHLHMCSLVG